MKNALKVKRIIDDLVLSNHVVLFLDFDGTLSEIARSPDLAKINKDMKVSVDKLSLLNNVQVAVVSGRALKNVMSLMGLKNIWYSGSHGFEIKTNKKSYVKKVSSDYLNKLAALTREIKKEFSREKGVFIETKKISTAIHFRNVNGPRRKEFDVFLDGFLNRKKDDAFRLIKGKEIVEFLPARLINKGTAINEMLKKLPRNTLPFYIGDDVTDESAFEVVNKDGVSIKVGSLRIKTLAKYCLKDPKEVLMFLDLCFKKLSSENIRKGRGLLK